MFCRSQNFLFTRNNKIIFTWCVLQTFLVENGSVRLSIILRKDRLNSDGQQIQQ